MFRKIMMLLAALSLIGLTFGGCSVSSTEATETDVVVDAGEFGEFKANNEEPAFGDPEIAEMLTEETDFADPVADMPEIVEAENDEATDIYCLRMVWGNLEGDSGVAELTDWSGSLTLTRGGIVVARLIRFEPRQDYILPRYNDSGVFVPEQLRWVSKTSWHFDGLVTRILIPPSVTDEVVMLTFESEQLSITFPFYELAELDTLINIGFGNAISFQATQYQPQGHLYGTLSGRWGRDEEGNGIFYGLWFNAAGTIGGTVRGRYGTDSTGNNIFVGKYINNAGSFGGLLKGSWNIETQDGVTYGRFSGRIYNNQRVPIGWLNGHFKRGQNRTAGFFAGRWRCCRGDNARVDDGL